MDFFKENKKPLLWLSLIFLLSSSIFWLKQGWMFIDTGREFYIPWQMLKGHLLYKDIFNIYGPLAYQINAFAFCIFGQKIEVLNSLGMLNSAIVVSCLFALCKEFFNKKLSFLITFFVMQASIFGINLFNFNMPYSYAMSYAFSAFLISLLFLIKYIKTENSLFAYISCFFTGIWISTKYDYCVFLLVLFYVFFFLKPLSKTSLTKSILSFLVIPTCSFGLLFFQGVRIQDLINTLKITIKMAEAPSLNYFYSHSGGMYFNPKIFIFSLVIFILVSALLLCYGKILAVGYKTQMPILHKILLGCYSIFCLLIFLMLSLNIFELFAMINFVLLIVGIKSIFKDKSLFILMLAAICASIKTFALVSMSTYGVFTMPFLLISVLAALKYLFENSKIENIKPIFENTIVFFLICFTFIAILAHGSKIIKKDYLLKTPKGSIYIDKFLVPSHEGLIEYIKKNLKPTDKIVILPETPFINFVTDKDSDNFYHSLISMYFETFGEDKIIEHFKKTKPEYIVINNRDTTDYGKKHICENYAFNFCAYVKQDYAFDKMVGNKRYAMLIMKRKDLK